MARVAADGGDESPPRSPGGWFGQRSIEFGIEIGIEIQGSLLSWGWLHLGLDLHLQRRRALATSLGSCRRL